MTKHITYIFSSTLFLLLSGCAISPVNINLHAASRLNFDQQYKSLPVEVKIYQLVNKNAFQQATFYELWKNDATTLGNSLLVQRSLTLAPGERTKIHMHRIKGARYLGFVAIFRHPSNSHWRSIQRIPKGIPLLPVNIYVNLNGNNIQ